MVARRQEVRVVITGGSGLVGRPIVRLLAREHEVRNLDLRPPSAGPAEHIEGDILDPDAVGRALEGAQAVVHAAALPGPSFGTEDAIERVNVDGTRVVAEAAADAGAGRFVYISSDSVLGFVFGLGRRRPEYLPVDEDHPLAPIEPYGRSKLAAEVLLARLASPAMPVVSLRPPWVWVPEEYDRCRRLSKDPETWWDGLWAYVHGDDLARAIRAALIANLERPYHAVYVAAPDNGTDRASRELVARYFADVPLRTELAGNESLISSKRCEKLLGTRPSMRWREFL